MEISNNILVKIKLGYNQFTRTERKIADYVLANSKDVPFMSITELSDACHVAEATPAMSRKPPYTAFAGRSRSKAIRNSK